MAVRKKLFRIQNSLMFSEISEILIMWNLKSLFVPYMDTQNTTLFTKIGPRCY